MVAAWINADTGVGPSIASGNHTCRGNWADFATAPQKINKATIARKPGLVVSVDTFAGKSLNTIEPVAAHNIRMPSIKPKSPTRLVRNAFLAAAAAESRWNQWPISR